MGVIDVFVGQKGVQQCLDRGVGRAGIEQVRSLHPHHLCVGERLAPAQFAQRREPHGGQAGRLDCRHVPAAALDTKGLPLLVEKVVHRSLDRGVAAPVQHQPRLAAQETRGIDAQREVAPDPRFGVVVDQPLGLCIRPQAVHSPTHCCRRTLGINAVSDPEKQGSGVILRIVDADPRQVSEGSLVL